jgi:hypothetical protein
VYTLGYALKVELELLTALKLGKQSRREVLRDYLSYFTNCLNPDISGSIGNVLTALATSRNEINSQFKNGDIWFNNFQYLGDIHRVCEDRAKEGTRCWSEFDLITIQLDYQLTGDLTSGFTGQLINPNKKSVGGRVKMNETSAYRNENDTLNGAKKHFEENQLSLYNSQVPIYKVLDENYNMLKEVEKACLTLIELCKTRLSEIQ